MNNIRISQCHTTDIPEVMAFIQRYWKADHVLATSRELMNWQHANADESYNYLIARSVEGIECILGYIPMSRYDPALASNEVVWLALWKMRPECKIAGLGFAHHRGSGTSISGRFAGGQWH